LAGQNTVLIRLHATGRNVVSLPPIPQH